MAIYNIIIANYVVGLQLSVLELVDILVETVFVARNGRAQQHLGDLYISTKRSSHESTGHTIPYL